MDLFYFFLNYECTYSKINALFSSTYLESCFYIEVTIKCIFISTYIKETNHCSVNIKSIKFVSTSFNDICSCCCPIDTNILFMNSIKCIFLAILKCNKFSYYYYKKGTLSANNLKRNISRTLLETS